MASEIAAPKPDGSRRQSDKKTILKHFLKGKLLAPKLRKSADKSLSQPWCSRSNTIYDLQLQKTIVLRMQPQHRATLTQPLQCVSQHPVANLHLSTDVATSNDDNEAAIPMQSATRDSRTAWNYAHRHNHSLQNTYRRRNNSRLQPLTRKNTRFRAPLPPQNIAHATFMQPLQCVFAQNDRSRTRRTDEVPFIVACSHFTRKNTRFGAPASSPKHSPCNIHAAITMRFAASRGKPAPIYARGNIKWRQWSSHSNAICNQRFKNRIELRTQTQPLVAKHIGGTIRAQNDRSRTRRTDEVPFIVGCSHFTRKNTRFRAPASSPKHSPCNIHAAITMRFATSRGKPAPIYARGNIKWRQWSSHSNAICNQRFKNRIELRTQTQPLVAKHIGGTIRAQNDRSRTRRTHEVPFIAGCSHFTRKNTRFRAPASSPKQSPCNIHAAIPMRSATTTSRKATLHGKTQGFVLRLPPQLTTSLPHRFPSSPLPIVTTSLRPLPFVTTSLPHHFPSSPPPFLTIPLHHHFPSSPLPIVTTSLRHHFPSSPLPIVTTSLRHHFPSSPLPFVTTRHYHHPSSKSIPLLLILLLCIVMLCIVMWSTTLHHVKSQNSICP